MLVFLDNARDEQQVIPLINTHENCRFLITSRNRLMLDGILPVELGCLPANDALDLALKLANRRWQSRLNELDASKLVELCGFLPLSIKVIASEFGSSRSLNIDRYLNKLENETRPVRAMDRAKIALRTSIASLPPEERRLWQALGIFEGDFARDAAAAVWKLDEPDEMLAFLEKRCLVAFDGCGRFQLHDLLRAVALEDLEASFGERSVFEQRHAAYYLKVLSEADSLFLAGENQTAIGLELYDLEEKQIEAARVWSMKQAPNDTMATKLVVEFSGNSILSLRLHPRTHVAWLETKVIACQKVGDRTEEASTLGHLGIAYKNLGEFRHAIKTYESGLILARENGDRQAEIRALGNIANAQRNLGEVQSAIGKYEQVLSISREIGDVHSEGASLSGLGSAYYELGDNERAIEYFELDLELSDRTGDQSGKLGPLGNLGLCHSALGETALALTYLNQCLNISRDIGHRRAEGFAVQAIGTVHAKSNQAQRAAESFREALEIFREIGDRRSEGECISELGLALVQLGRVSEAIELYEKALNISREVGDRQREGTAEFRLACARMKLGEETEAIAQATRALAIFDSISVGHRAEEVRTTINAWKAS